MVSPVGHSAPTEILPALQVPCSTYLSPYTISQMMHVPSRLAVTHSRSSFFTLMQETAETCSFRTSTSFWVTSRISQTLTWKPATDICSCTSWSWAQEDAYGFPLLFFLEHTATPSQPPVSVFLWAFMQLTHKSKLRSWQHNSLVQELPTINPRPCFCQVPTLPCFSLLISPSGKSI